MQPGPEVTSTVVGAVEHTRLQSGGQRRESLGGDESPQQVGVGGGVPAVALLRV